MFLKDLSNALHRANRCYPAAILVLELAVGAIAKISMANHKSSILLVKSRVEGNMERVITIARVFVTMEQIVECVKASVK